VEHGKLLEDYAVSFMEVTSALLSESNTNSWKKIATTQSERDESGKYRTKNFLWWTDIQIISIAVYARVPSFNPVILNVVQVDQRWFTWNF